MARSFREAEEASNAQGIVQEAVTWAFQNAQKNPTAENIAIAKDTYAAQQSMLPPAPAVATGNFTYGAGNPLNTNVFVAQNPYDLVPTVTIGGAPAGYMPRIIAESQAAIASTEQTIEQINKDIAAVNVAGEAAGAISKSMGGPSWSPITAVNNTTPAQTNKPTTARDILLQALLETGMPADVAEASLNFVQSVMDDGMAQDAAIKTLYNFKDFTTKAGVKLVSPFYARYTSLGEGLTGAERKSPLELMNFALTTEKLVKNYGFSDKFYSYDSLKKYVQNNVSPTDLEPRMQAARLKTTEADPTYVAGLQKLGYISGAQDLADFFLDPTIGKQQLEINATAADFAQANLQRASYGLRFDPTQIKRISAQYAGMDNAGALAASGYEKIAQTLMPEYNLATMYEQPRGTILNKEQQAEMQQSIQSQLEQEQFTSQGLASQERKRRLAELAANAFQAQSGVFGGRSTSYSRQSTAGMI